MTGLIDIGDDYTIAVDIRVDDELVDPGSVQLEVTNPSGVASNPSLSNPAVGSYRATITITELGRWRWTWTTTAPAGAHHGYVDVPADPPIRLDLLATPADLEDRFGTLTESQLLTAPFHLHDASALIRAECRPHRFSSVIADDTKVLRPVGGLLRLPDPPVQSVLSVAAIDALGGPDVGLALFAFDGLDTIDLNRSGFFDSLGFALLDRGRHAGTFRVVYTHGDAPADEIVAKTCQMVNRLFGANSKQEGVTQETIGQFTRQWQQGQGSPGPSVVLTQRDRDDLGRWGYRQTAGSIPLTSG